jgi:hypothetical protein
MLELFEELLFYLGGPIPLYDYIPYATRTEPAVSPSIDPTSPPSLSIVCMGTHVIALVVNALSFSEICSRELLPVPGILLSVELEFPVC